VLQILNNKIRMVIIMFISVRLAERIHSKLLHKVLNAPINLFFDVTPIGRILNSFSRDMHSCDRQTMNAILRFFLYVYDCIGKIVIAMAVVPQLLVPLSLNLILSVKLLLFVNRGLTQVQRVNKANGAQITSQLCESLTGSAVIRAFN